MMWGYEQRKNFVNGNEFSLNELSCDTAIALIGIYLRDKKSLH